MGIKLANFGHNIKIFDSSVNKINQWIAGQIPDILKQGIFITNEISKSKLNEILSMYVTINIY
jgi:hypothetical protein